jgi:hypothetical protein
MREDRTANRQNAHNQQAKGRYELAFHVTYLRTSCLPTPYTIPLETTKFVTTDSAIRYLEEASPATAAFLTIDKPCYKVSFCLSGGKHT